MRIVIFVILLINLFLPKVYANDGSFIVLKINDQIITNIDLKKEKNYLIALNNELKKLKQPEIEKIAKESLIREKIKENEVNRYGLDADTEYVNQIIKKFISRLNLETEQQFNEYLKNFDLTNTEVRKKINIETSWNGLIFKVYGDQIIINKDKIEKKIRKNKKNKKIQKQYRLSEIVFEIDSGQSVNKKYEIIKKEIIKLGFKNAANKFSISDTAKFGGETGWIDEDQLSDNIINKIKVIKVGEYTHPINIVGGQLILKLEETKIINKVVNYDDLINNALNYERNKQLEQFSKIYFNKIKINTIIDEK